MFADVGEPHLAEGEQENGEREEESYSNHHEEVSYYCYT